MESILRVFNGFDTPPLETEGEAMGTEIEREYPTNRDGHSPEIRRALKATREREGKSARALSEKIGDILRRSNPSAANPHINTIYAWENFRRDPPVDSMAAWAESLGYSLRISLGDLRNPRRQIDLKTDDAVAVARLVDEMPEHQRSSILAMVRSFS